MGRAPRTETQPWFGSATCEAACVHAVSWLQAAGAASPAISNNDTNYETTLISMI
ncbi:hypothetical protein BDA96_03G415700 [Sorghum bicolor]|uniref:Uncharacterized protein n=1 Tax=Sorghum bicolor TaxID=4558 RepID=A0A921RIN0_SORBI|nr:hypothetical protein BDA96_03G415700 [Sorghum bicolor]